MEVGEITKKVVVVEDNLSVKDVAKIMSEKNLGSVVVVDNGNIIGIVTERDILKNLDKQSKPISTVMSKNVLTINVTDSIEEAKDIMIKNKKKRLPVLDEGKLVGIVKITNVLAEISEEIEEPFLFN